MTLYAVYNSEGCQGRCDAKCYNAKSANCTCICGGMNHGSGEKLAIAQTQEHFDEIVKNLGKENLRISDTVKQLFLPI